MTKKRKTNQIPIVLIIFFLLIALIVIPFLLISFRKGDFISSANPEKEKIRLVGKPESSFLAQSTPQIKIRTKLSVEELKKRLIILNSLKMPVDLPFEISQKGEEKTITFLAEGEFKPGFYTLQITGEGGVNFKQDFSWGVLAINTNKSSYSPGETAEIYMTVLDNRGKTVCDADVVLTIIAPSGKRTFFKTSDNTIEKSPECQPKNVTYRPDFKAAFQIPEEKGKYRLLLSANLKDGQRRIEDQLLVDPKQKFIISRTGPIRIYPLSSYDLKIKILARTDFTGVIEEKVPASFVISTADHLEGGVAPAAHLPGERTLSWQVNLKAGEEKNLSYRFKAPDISPEFYLLGPLTLRSLGEGGPSKLVFTEPRAWQIASDANPNMILFLDASESTPSGWTCISCSPTDTFWQKFPRGEATYGGTGGATTHTHTITSGGSGAASDNLAKIGTAGGTYNRADHTHALASFSYPANETANLPPFRELRVIKYNSGIPSIIPQNAIAIFNDALPGANWDAYTTENNYYIRGGDITTTGGSATHTHQPTIEVSAGYANYLKGAGSTAIPPGDHTHSSGSGSTDAADNRPSRVSIALGKASTNTSIPTNMIAMFDDTPTSDWQVLSSSGNDFYQRFLFPSTSYAIWTNNTNHTHTDLAIDTGGASTSENTGLTAATQNIATTAHTHSITVSFAQATGILPPYVNVIIARYGVYPANMLIFEDTSATPSGWLCVSCTAGDPFYLRYPRGEATYGGTGGADTHTHTASFSVAAAASGLARSSTGSSYAITAHSHSVSTYSVSAKSNLPLTKNLKVLRYNNGIPSALPANGVVMFDASIPAGASWSRYAAQDTYFIRGGVDVSTAGANTHTHAVSFTTGNSLNNATTYGSTQSTGVVIFNHTHTGSGNTGSESNEPPKVIVILGQTSSSTSLPWNMITMFDNTPGAPWDMLSDSGDTFYQKYLQGDSAYSTSANTGTHTHANLNINSSSKAADATFNMDQLNNGLAIAHTHAVTVSSISSESTLAPYINVIIAKLMAYPPANCFVTETINSNNLTFHWSDLTTGELRFLIQISTNSAAFTDYAILNPDTTSYLDTKTTTQNTYLYQVRAEQGSVSTGWCTSLAYDTLKGNLKLEKIKMEGIKINYQIHNEFLALFSDFLEKIVDYFSEIIYLATKLVSKTIYAAY